MDWTKSLISNYFGKAEHPTEQPTDEPTDKPVVNNAFGDETERDNDIVECSLCHILTQSKDCYDVHDKVLSQRTYECIDEVGCQARKTAAINKVMCESRRHLKEFASRFHELNREEEWEFRFEDEVNRDTTTTDNDKLTYEDLRKEFTYGNYEFYVIKNNEESTQNPFIWCSNEEVWLRLSDVENYPHLTVTSGGSGSCLKSQYQTRKCKIYYRRRNTDTCGMPCACESYMLK